MPRIPPLPESEWDETTAPTLQVRTPGLQGRLGDNNIFSTLARHQSLMRAWLPFGAFLLGRGVLGARERELHRLLARRGHDDPRRGQVAELPGAIEGLVSDRRDAVAGDDLAGTPPAIKVSTPCRIARDGSSGVEAT